MQGNYIPIDVTAEAVVVVVAVMVAVVVLVGMVFVVHTIVIVVMIDGDVPSVLRSCFSQPPWTRQSPSRPLLAPRHTLYMNVLPNEPPGPATEVLLVRRCRRWALQRS